MGLEEQRELILDELKELDRLKDEVLDRLEDINIKIADKKRSEQDREYEGSV